VKRSAIPTGTRAGTTSDEARVDAVSFQDPHAVDLRDVSRVAPPPNQRFSEAAPEAAIERTASGLRAHGFTVHVVSTPADAFGVVTGLVPDGAEVYTAASATLRDAGLEEYLNRSGRWISIRSKQFELDHETQRGELRKLLSCADVVVGSVHAITEDGTLVAASAGGSQLGLYARGAGRLIYVVGSQKIVPDLDTALRRVYEYSYPMEDVRARTALGYRSAVNKVLIVNAEFERDRSTVVLVRQPIGY
jgi:hypothetical protein